MSDIFKIRTLGVCKKVQLDEKTGFTCYELKLGNEFRSRDLQLNFIVFVLGGSIEVSCNQYENCRIQQEQMILLMRSSAVHIKALKRTTLCMMYFDTFLSSCDQQLFNAYLPDTEKISYTFSPIAIPQLIARFLNQMRDIQEQNVDCQHFHNLKHREFFILLRHFCPREDLVRFLAPLLGRSINFRNKVMEKYAQLKSGRVTELADLMGMGRKNFDKQFRKEFENSPAKWMLEEKAKRLFVFLHEPDVTITDAIDHFYFNSSAHFNRFCLKHFSKTPGAIIKDSRKIRKRKKIKREVSLRKGG